MKKEEINEKAFEPLGDYEKDLMATLETLEFTDDDLASPDKKTWAAEIARNTIEVLERKEAKISLRLNGADLTRLKAEALEQGLPYQTLLSSIVHQYVTGRLRLVG